MKIERARQLKIGQLVNFPADRGDPAGDGYVTHISPIEQTHMGGKPFLWVTVRYTGGKRSGVWPSNRLG